MNGRELADNIGRSPAWVYLQGQKCKLPHHAPRKYRQRYRFENRDVAEWLFRERAARPGDYWIRDPYVDAYEVACNTPVEPTQDECPWETERVVSRALATLTPKEQEVLRRRYGMERDEQTLDDVGADLGMSRERTRQVEQKALERLRSHALDILEDVAPAQVELHRERMRQEAEDDRRYWDEVLNRRVVCHV